MCGKYRYIRCNRVVVRREHIRQGRRTLREGTGKRRLVKITDPITNRVPYTCEVQITYLLFRMSSKVGVEFTEEETLAKERTGYLSGRRGQTIVPWKMCSGKDRDNISSRERLIIRCDFELPTFVVTTRTKLTSPTRVSRREYRQ